MSASKRKLGEFAYEEGSKYKRKSPKFGSNGTKYGTKSERKHRKQHLIKK